MTSYNVKAEVLQMLEIMAKDLENHISIGNTPDDSYEHHYDIVHAFALRMGFTVPDELQKSAVLAPRTKAMNNRPSKDINGFEHSVWSSWPVEPLNGDLVLVSDHNGTPLYTTLVMKEKV